MTKSDYSYEERRAQVRQDTPISLLEAKLTRGEQEAQKLVCQLADAMFRCGYTRDGTYNSRSASFSGRRDRATILYWRKGKILLGRGVKKDKHKKPITDSKGHPVYHDPLHPREWTANELIDVALHLAPFLDALENNVRHQVEQLQKATQTIRDLIDRIDGDPQPSENPAQMSEDPEVEDAAGD